MVGPVEMLEERLGGLGWMHIYGIFSAIAETMREEGIERSGCYLLSGKNYEYTIECEGTTQDQEKIVVTAELAVRPRRVIEAEIEAQHTDGPVNLEKVNEGLRLYLRDATNPDSPILDDLRRTTAKYGYTSEAIEEAIDEIIALGIYALFKPYIDDIEIEVEARGDKTISTQVYSGTATARLVVGGENFTVEFKFVFEVEREYAVVPWTIQVEYK